MNPRPACCVFIATSVDGFIAREDGSLDWLECVEHPGEDYGFQRFFDSIDALVVGRTTYDFASSFEPWPYAGKRCVVLTHRPFQPKANEEHFSGEPAVLLEKLGREGVRRVYVDGGAVIRQFLAARLVDELTLSRIPVLLGSGIPLFGAGVEQPLSLVENRSFPSGLVQTTWQLSAAATDKSSKARGL
jgi:dihydrofolate reductase